MARQFGNAGKARGNSQNKLFLVGGGFVVVLILIVASIFMVPGEKKPVAKAVIIETDSQEPQVKMVDVLVPIQDIEPGAELEPKMFRKESRPQVGVSDRVVRDFEELQGYFTRSLIVTGQPLHRDLITNVRPVNKITANIPEGFRAVTISVDTRSAVEGWVRPGAKVDVAWASSIRGQPALTVIVQNARVLSAERQTDANVQAGAPVPATVTLLVAIEDAKKVQLAQTTGSLTLQLRGDPDTGKGAGGSTSITVNDLIGGVPSKAQIDCKGEVKMGSVTYCLTSAGALKPKELLEADQDSAPKE